MDFNRVDKVPGFSKGEEMAKKPLQKPTQELSEKSIQKLCQEALALLQDVSLSTQGGEDHCIPQKLSQKFSAIVLTIQKKRQDKEVYAGLVTKILDKIYRDNRKDLLQGLELLGENDRKERLSKIEMYEKKGHKAFTALIGLMNAPGHKKIRPAAGNDELSALDFLSNVRKRFANKRVSRQTFAEKETDVKFHRGKLF